MRIAIDISIWQFQIQSGRGGSNPALRTLYYRLLRLLALNIQPLFVFDGPHKPPFKRNVRTQQHTASLPNFLAKQLLKLFGFPYYTAPGEAEAECALLQQEGMVAAVLSEDVDTLMFGCSMSLRNWSSEGTRGRKCPTHVNIYDAEKIRTGKAGLDRHGMVLVALMSGGDYIPAGIPGCGIKIACEAARAGFGTDLCKISRKDSVGLRQWRERLEYELHTNESGYFRVKHRALKVPEKFPDKMTLGYYTHPVVSSPEKLQSLKESLNWEQEVDVVGLRSFVAEAFEWQNLSGAKKFIRGFAPALLMHRLRVGAERGSTASNGTADRRLEQESQLVQVICGRRTHFITDGIPELRIAYVPTQIVGLDLEKEEADSTFDEGAEISDGHISDFADEPESRSASPSKKRGPSQYDPTQPEKIWVLETFVKIGIPLTVESWEEDMRNPKKFASRKAIVKRALAKGGMKKGALEPYVKITKPHIEQSARLTACNTDGSTMPLAFLAPITAKGQWGHSNPAVRKPKTMVNSFRDGQKGTSSRTRNPLKAQPKSNPTAESPVISVQADPAVNPWTLSRRPSDTFNVSLPSGTRYSALGIYGSKEACGTGEDGSERNSLLDGEDSLVSSSPSADRKHRRSSPLPIEHDTMQQVKKPDLQEAPELQSCETISTKPHPSAKEPDRPSTHRSQRPISSVTATSESTQFQPPTRTPRTYTSTQMIDPLDDRDHYAVQPASSQRINRRIDFNSLRKQIQDSPISVSSSLPSPSTLIPAPRKPPTEITIEITSLLPAGGLKPLLPSPSRRRTENGRSRRYIALRESLAGAWKEVDTWEAGIRKTVYQGVEVLDLTST